MPPGAAPGAGRKRAFPSHPQVPAAPPTPPNPPPSAAAGSGSPDPEAGGGRETPAAVRRRAAGQGRQPRTPATARSPPHGRRGAAWLQADPPINFPPRNEGTRGQPARSSRLTPPLPRGCNSSASGRAGSGVPLGRRA